MHRWGMNLDNGTVFSGGVSMSIIGLGITLRKILAGFNMSSRPANRIAATLEGVLLCLFWGVPFDAVEAYSGKLDTTPDIFVLGGRFYLRHFYGIINNEAPHTDDLQAHISFRPWEQKQEPRYISALNAKRIPPLSIDHSLASSVAEGIITVPGTKHAVINLLGALSEGMEISWGQVRGLGRIRIGRQYLLPSQILDLLHKQRGGKPLIVFLKTVFPTLS